MSRFLWALVGIVCLVIVPTAALSQDNHNERVAAANQGTVSIISGGIGGTYIRIATDLAAVLDAGENLRILPIAGKGSMQNIHDILYLKGIDLGIVQSDVLAYIKRERLYPGIEQRLRYVTKLYNEEFHLVVRDGVKSIEELAGQSVNFGIEGSGTHMTASTIFDSLNLNVQPTNFDQALALEKLKAGEIAAVAYVTGKPARAFVDVSPQDGLRLISVPYTEALQQNYLPSFFTEQDYAGMVPPGEEVETVAVGAVMAVFNWNNGSFRYKKVERFIEAFFSRFAEFQKTPRHKKWQEVNLAAKVPGWERFGAAEVWLENNAQVASIELKSTFQQFLDNESDTSTGAQLSAAEREELFQQFLRWQQNQVQ
jgi:TRAP transporter TAXI family solute receptor